jgi:hypothetical protein
MHVIEDGLLAKAAAKGKRVLNREKSAADPRVRVWVDGFVSERE